MATGFIAGLLVAFFGAAVGAVFGQFLRFYSQRITDMENLINTLHSIKELDAGTVNWTVKRRDATVWQLRNWLRKIVLSSRGLLSNETHAEVNELFKNFDTMGSNTPRSTLGEDINHTHNVHDLNDHAENALSEIEQVGWWECARQFFFPSR